MAKKKTEAKSETTTKKKAAAPAAKKTEAKSSSSASSSTRAAAKSSKPTTSPMMPMVDTSLAAQTAAQMLGAGLGRRDQGPSGEDKREGSLIRQLKADLNKGHSQTVSNVLDKGAPQGTKKGGGNLPFGQKQVGRNQTYGADVTRSGVPRRTSG